MRTPFEGCIRVNSKGVPWKVNVGQVNPREKIVLFISNEELEI